MKASGCEVELSRNRFTNQEAFVSHANAALTPRARLRLAQLIVEGGWTYAAAAKMFMVAPRTAKKWADRFRTEGALGMADRSSRPRVSPTRTGPEMVRQIIGVRWRHRLGPVQIAGRLGMPGSTVHAVLTRCRINRLSAIDRVTGEPLRRYEHPHPGALIHVDVTKFGNIPDGGGHKFVSRQQSKHNSVLTAQRTGNRGDRTKNWRPRIGTAFVHTVIDDHSRMAYAEICTDEKAATAIGVRCSARWRGSPSAASLLSECSPTTGRPIGPTPGATPAPNCGSPPSELVPTDLKPTAKLSDFTAHWPTAGPTPGSTSQPNSATPPCQAGCISIITTEPIPPSEASHQSLD